MKEINAMNDVAENCNEFLSNYRLPSPKDIMNYFCHSPGKLIVIGARPAMGKTGLMLSLINEHNDNAVLAYTLELSESKLIKRLENISKEKSTHLPFFFSVPESSQWFGSKPSLFINYSKSIDLEKVRSILVEQQNDVPVKVVFIDYFQLLKDTDTKCLNQLKQFAEEFKVAMVVLSQVTKDINDNPVQKPKLHGFMVNDLETSMVDEIYYLVRPNYHDIREDEWGYSMKNQAIIHCLKGSFQGNRMLLKFNKKNSGFQQSDIFEIFMKTKKKYKKTHA